MSKFRTILGPLGPIDMAEAATKAQIDLPAERERVKQIKTENAALRSQLAVCVEALGIIKDISNDLGVTQHATEALAKVSSQGSDPATAGASEGGKRNEKA